MELREGGVEGVVSEVTGIQYESTPCDTVSEWTLDIGNCGAVEERVTGRARTPVH